MSRTLDAALDPDQLIERYQRLVHHEVNSFLRRQPFLVGCEKEDLVSVGLIGLARAAKGYKSARSQFSTYAATAIRREIIKEAERLSRDFRRYRLASLDDVYDSANGSEGERLVDRLPDTGDIEQSVLDRLELEELFRESVRRLHEFSNVSVRRIILSHIFDDRSFAEMAKEEGKTSAAISLRYHKALKQLRNMR